MPYNIKVTQINNGFIGQVTKDGQLVFETVPQKDTNAVTAQITAFMKNSVKTDRPVAPSPKNKPTKVSQFTIHNPPLQTDPPRRCCGRG